jgi:activating signal cointegrator complex subunit 3
MFVLPAPVGAQTSIAMLAILHELSSHMRGETLLRDQFKIVYVAPMKALAAEQAEVRFHSC